MTQITAGLRGCESFSLIVPRQVSSEFERSPKLFQSIKVLGIIRCLLPLKLNTDSMNHTKLLPRFSRVA